MACFPGVYDYCNDRQNGRSLQKSRCLTCRPRLCSLRVSRKRAKVELRKKKPLPQAAAQAGSDEKTARKYRDLGRLPCEVRVDHTWRTRRNPFDDVWEEIRTKLDLSSGLQAKTLLDELLDELLTGRYLAAQYGGEGLTGVGELERSGAGGLGARTSAPSEDDSIRIRWRLPTSRQ